MDSSDMMIEHNNCRLVYRVSAAARHCRVSTAAATRTQTCKLGTCCYPQANNVRKSRA